MLPMPMLAWLWQAQTGFDQLIVLHLRVFFLGKTSPKEAIVFQTIICSMPLSDLFSFFPLLVVKSVDLHVVKPKMANLLDAARDDDGELLERLLAQPGVDVNFRNKFNRTPLMFACRKGHENIVKRLCQVPGIELNSTDDGGYTALYWAVFSNRPACVSVLREVAGVDWNVRTYLGNSPLTVAVYLGRADILQTILSVPEPDLDLSVTDNRGRNIAQIAVEENWGPYGQKCVELLSGDKRVDWNKKNSDGDTPVMYCLKSNVIERARFLINIPGVDLNTVDADGRYLEDIARSVFDSMYQSNNNHFNLSGRGT